MEKEIENIKQIGDLVILTIMNKNSFILSRIKKIINELSLKINAPASSLPKFRNTIDSHPFIEINDGTYNFIVSERGVEIERKTTLDLDELLYWIFENVTFEMAMQYELIHRENNKDFRRLLFSHQESLMGYLNESWKIKITNYHNDILEKNPFDDYSDARLNFFKSLKNDNISEDHSWKIACQKFPLPNIESDPTSQL